MTAHLTGRPGLIALAFVLALGQCVLPAMAQDTVMSRQEMASLNWLNGPATVPITDYAEIALPEGYMALSAPDTARLMQVIQNVAVEEAYYVGPQDKSWYAIFTFDSIGHVADDERVDPDEVIAALRARDEVDNADRRARGASIVRLRGWKYPPFYDADSRRLTWATESEIDDAVAVSYNTRILGRSGVMSATMVVDGALADTAVRQFQGVLDGFRFLPGNAFGDYQPTDVKSSQLLSQLIADRATVNIPSLDQDSGSVLDSVTTLAGSIAAGLALGAVAWWLFGRKR